MDKNSNNENEVLSTQEKIEKLRKETEESFKKLNEKKDKDIQNLSDYIDKEREEENKQETSLKKTSGIGRFFAKIKSKFNKVFATRAAIIAGAATLAVGGATAASSSKKSKPEDTKGRVNTTDENKRISDDMFKTKISPMQKEAAKIVDNTIAEDEEKSKENDFREELSNQTVGSDKVPEAPTVSDDTLKEAMSKVGIDPSEVENPNYVPIHEPVSKDIESPTQEIKFDFEDETKQEDKNEETKKDLSDVKEATGETQVVAPSKKDESNTENKDHNVKQEKDENGNIKKEEHYVDENPFER